MRLFPAYVALPLITGQSPGMRTSSMTKEQRIREGHRMLVQMCRCDHGYDLLAWHAELCETKAGGYRWGRRRGIPKLIQNALDDPGWREAVAEIERVDAQRAAARAESHHRGVKKMKDRGGFVTPDFAVISFVSGVVALTGAVVLAKLSALAIWACVLIGLATWAGLFVLLVMMVFASGRRLSRVGEKANCRNKDADNADR